MPNCQTCVNFLCTLCNAGFYLQPSDSLCYPCSSIHRACTTCSSINLCDSCDIGYILVSTTAGSTCDLCGNFINNCTECSSTSICTNCDFEYGLNALSKCQLCSVTLYNCLTCENTFVCLECKPGYFLGIDSLSRNPTCLSCLNIINYCSACNGIICTSCMSPYLLGLDGTCSLCRPGYENVGGTCTQIAGCQLSVTTSNGS